MQGSGVVVGRHQAKARRTMGAAGLFNWAYLARRKTSPFRAEI
jgi:hypothetical protein